MGYAMGCPMGYPLWDFPPGDIQWHIPCMGYAMGYPIPWDISWDIPWDIRWDVPWDVTRDTPWDIQWGMRCVALKFMRIGYLQIEGETYLPIAGHISNQIKHKIKHRYGAHLNH